MKILVSGATGFIGHSVCARLAKEFHVYGLTRRDDAVLPDGTTKVVMDLHDLNHSTIPETDVVIHLAARVHVMNERATDPLSEFRAANVQATLDLAQQACLNGVKRFIYMSSVKVNGEATKPGQPFTAYDAPAPESAYGISKMEAEIGLRKFAADTGMEMVIVRPPLVYGPGVKANFESMLKWIARGIPLPFGAIDNHRSLVGLDNLVDLLRVCISHPSAAGRTFMASDGEDLSTPELLKRLGNFLNKPARLVSVPPGLLKISAGLAGQGKLAERLLDNLQVDISDTCRTLNWTPPVNLQEGLQKTASTFLNHRQ